LPLAADETPGGDPPSHQPQALQASGLPRAASRSTSPRAIALPGGLPAFALVAVTDRRWLVQALPGLPVAARVDSLPRMAGVALARFAERLAHTLPVQLSCLVLVDHVLESSLVAESTDPTRSGIGDYCAPSAVAFSFASEVSQRCLMSREAIGATSLPRPLKLTSSSTRSEVPVGDGLRL
jgi:hypothetical protein